MSKFAIRHVMHAIGDGTWTTCVHMSDNELRDESLEWLSARVATGPHKGSSFANIKIDALMRLHELLELEITNILTASKMPAKVPAAPSSPKAASSFRRALPGPAGGSAQLQ